MKPFDVVVIPPAGVARRDRVESLAGLRALVGGDIEYIGWTGGAGGFLNEDGKALGLPPNRQATAWAHAHGLIWAEDVIVGPVVLVGPPDDDGCETDVPAAEAARWLPAGAGR